MSARRAARAAAAKKASAAPPGSFDWRAPEYGIPRWPPGPDNPVPLSVVMLARRRARESRARWEASDPETTAPRPSPSR